MHSSVIARVGKCITVLAGTIALLFLGMQHLAATALGQSNQIEARSIIEKSLKAHGGKQKLKALRNCSFRSKGTIFSAPRGKTDYSAEIWYALPDKFRNKIEIHSNDKKVVIEFVLNGPDAWESNGETTKDMAPELIKSYRRMLYVYNAKLLFPLLENDMYSIRRLEDEMVEGRKLCVICISSLGEEDIKFYFDSEKYLLTKILDFRKGPDRISTFESIYSGYRNLQGIEYPAKETGFIDGKLHRERIVTELILYDKINSKVFNKP